jgi:hypothetical protein
MSTNNVNIVNTNNWYQKMTLLAAQNASNMVLSGTNPSTQLALITASNDGAHYCYSNYPLSKTNGFTMSFQFYISVTNIASICVYFGVTDPTVSFDPNSGVVGQSGAVELRIAPASPIFQLYTNYGTNSVVATSSTSVATGSWQTVTITFTPSATATWVVNYNGTNVISYNDTLFTSFTSNQNTLWGIYGGTSNAVTGLVRAVDLSVKQSIPMSILKNTYSFYPEECFINKLSTHSQTNAAAAFGLRLLRSDYLGAVINIRRGSDNATLDFYADSKGNLGSNLFGNGQTLLAWLGGSIGYITRMYDQTGNGRDVIQSTTSAQPKIGTPILDSMSTAGKSAARGAYALYDTNSTYQGATIRLRRSADNFTSDFYSDVYGNLNNSLSVDNSVNTWTARTSNLASQGIAWSPELNLFAATNYNGGNFTTNAIQTSPDGITWTTRTTPNIRVLSYIIWAPERSLFVATSYQAGTSNVITSPDGINWTQRTTPSTAFVGWHDLAWSPQLSLFVSVNGNTTTNTSWVITSPDGTTWTQRTTPSGSLWSGVCWSPQLYLFVAVNRNTTTTSAVATSPDGITWTIRTTPSISSISRIRWSPELNLLVAVGTNSCITSPDGINWTSRSVPTGNWEGLVWCSELSIFTATKTDLSTNCIMTSSDGITWTSRTTPSTQCWDIAWSPSLSTFVAVNPLSTTLITSAQGLIANSTFSSWIGSSTAYVDTWYDQSGNNFHATQSTTANQPVYNGTLRLLDFSTQYSFLNMGTASAGPIPTGTLNAQYTFVAKHGAIGTISVDGGIIVAGGAAAVNQLNGIGVFPNYGNYWYGNDLHNIATPVSGNTFVVQYDGTNRISYVNNNMALTAAGSGYTVASGYQQYIGRDPRGENTSFKGQLYNIFIFGSALSDSDRFACTSNPTDINIKYDGSQCLIGGTTNWPLTNGLKNYTYIFNGRIDGNNIPQSIIQMGPWNANNTGSALYTYLNYYGFAGFGNDALNIVAYTPFVNRKCVMMCNHNLNTGNVVINDNGTIYTATTPSPSALNLTNAYFTIGAVVHSPTGAAFTGNINEIIIFKNTLTPKESQIYFTPNAITRKAYKSQPRLQIKDVPKDIGAISAGAVVALDTQMLSLSPGSLVTSWNGFTGYNGPVLNAATYNSTGLVYDIPPYVSFVNNGISAGLSTGKYLDAGSKTFNVNTNGGFTAIWYGAFTGSVNDNERIFDFGNGQASDNILALRAGSGTSIYFFMFNGSADYSIVTGSGVITQNEWAVWTFRYTASSRQMEILKNGALQAIGTAGAAITDKTLTKTWIGRSNWTASAVDYYSNINTAGFYVYDNYRTDTQIASISNHLMYSTTATVPSALPDSNNKIVRYGSVLSQGFRNGQAMYFNGHVDSYLDIQDIPNWPLTFCFWFRNTSTAGTSPATLCSQDGAGNGSAGWGIQVDIFENGTSLGPHYSTNGSTYTPMTPSTVSINTWYHVAFVVTPTTVAYYLNGTLIQSVAAVVYNTNRLVIGKSGDNVRPLNGYIQDIRVFDYALRADEITAMTNSGGEERTLTNYNTPSNYLVNMSNWYSIMNLYKTGSYTIYTAGSGTNVFYQLTSTVADSSNTVFNSTRIQNYNSFTCSFEIQTDTANGDGFYFYCGATSSTTVPTGTAGTAANSSYYFYFKTSGTKGIYLFNDQGQQLSYSPVSATILTSGTYVPITIVYNRSTRNTWTFNVASRDVLVYDDPNNTNWVSNIAGDIWGIGARTTSNTMYCYIRRLELAYTPFVNTVSTSVNAQNNTKFPPGAMTAPSTTFTGSSILDGVYTATQSSPGEGGGVVAYYAFDNNPNSHAGEITAYNYNTGIYTGSKSTIVKNLVTNVNTSYSGEWLQIGLPNALSLNSFGLMGRQDANLVLERTPTTFYIAGSNDGSTWDLLHTTSGAQFTLAMQYFTCNAGNTNKYSYFRLIANKIGNSGASIRRENVAIGTWDLFTQMNTVNANVITVPPYSMTADTTTFAGNSVYDGAYTVTSSNTHSHPDMGPRYTIFNNAGGYGNIWSPGQYHNGSGVYVGSTSTTVAGVAQTGEWIQLELPNPIVLYSFSLNFWWVSQSYWLKSFIIAASNDNSTWTNIYDNTNASFVYGTAQTFVVTGSSNAYKYFRLIGRSTSGIYQCEWWILDQWKLYTNASNFNLMKFPPAPLTADSPVTFTTLNTNNWYNIGFINNSGGSFVPIISGSDPLTQLQLTDGRVGVGTGFAFANQPVMNYDSFTLTFQLFCSGNGDHLILSFGDGGYSQGFLFQVYSYGGISFNGIQSPTNWFNNTWNNIRIEYLRGPTNTWTLFFNETQIIQYSDPTWFKTPGSQWGFSTFNGAATFVSYIRQLEMTIAPVSIPGNSIVSGSYIASASSNFPDYMSPSYAFNDSLKNTSIGRMWHSGINYSSGPYTGAVTTTVSGTSYAGDYLQLQTPNPLVLRSFSIYPRQDGGLWSTRSPKNFVMAGSNDNSTWYLLHTATGVNDWSASEKYFVCNGTSVASKYSYFRLVVTSLLSGGDSLQIQNLNLYTPMTLNNSITPATPKGLLDGLTWKYYDGYSDYLVSYYTTNTYRNIGRTTDTTNLTKITNGQVEENSATYLFSIEMFGYFRATVSGTYTFSLSSDDGSFLWVGQNALVGYTTSNFNIGTPAANTPATYSVTLLAGTYYPIRIHYTKNYLRNANLTFSFTPPGGTQTSNGQGFFFSGTGMDAAFPQESAKIIKDLTNTNKDGVYYILVNGISTPIHCLMNDCYDGGGWMLLMKGTRGSTFQYSSNYWSTKNTLNAGDLTRNDADAKYNTYNYSTVKDVLAIFPDIPSRSYTNVYGQNGGSIFVDDGWTWMVNNWNETSRTTPLTGFNTATRAPHQNTSSIFQTYGINNPFRYNGFGGWCYTSVGAYYHCFNGDSNVKVKWGFIFNNETGDLNSCDTFCGIGMGGEVGYSAGDWGRAGANWGGQIGINRTARFEMYGR